MKKLLFVICCCLTLALSGCYSYKLNKDYGKQTYGYVVFVSQSGKSYDDLWVNVGGLNKTFLASTSKVQGDEVQGPRYGVQQGNRDIMVRQKNDRLLFRGKAMVTAGQLTIVTLDD